MMEATGLLAFAGEQLALFRRGRESAGRLRRMGGSLRLDGAGVVQSCDIIFCMGDGGSIPTSASSTPPLH